MLSFIIGNPSHFLNKVYSLKEKVRLLEKDLKWNNQNHLFWPGEVRIEIMNALLLSKRYSLPKNLYGKIIAVICNFHVREWFGRMIISESSYSNMEKETSCSCNSLPFNETQCTNKCNCAERGKGCSFNCSCKNCGNEGGKEILFVADFEEAEDVLQGRKMSEHSKNDVPFKVLSPYWCFNGARVSFFDKLDFKMKEGVIRQIHKELVWIVGNEKEGEEKENLSIVECFKTFPVHPNSKGQMSVVIKRNSAVISHFGCLVLVDQIFKESHTAKVRDTKTKECFVSQLEDLVVVQIS